MINNSNVQGTKIWINSFWEKGNVHLFSFLVPIKYSLSTNCYFSNIFKNQIPSLLFRLSFLNSVYATLKSHSQHCLTYNLKSSFKDDWRLFKQNFCYSGFFFMNFTCMFLSFIYFKTVLLTSSYVFLCLTLYYISILCKCIAVKSLLLKKCILWLKLTVVIVSDECFWWQRQLLIIIDNWSNMFATFGVVRWEL